MQKDSAVAGIVRRLPIMNRRELTKLWVDSYGKPPHPKLSPELMRPVLAFRLQERAYGGFSPDTARQIEQIARSLAPDSRPQGEAHNRFKAGTRIIREWKGKTYEVLISGDGYAFAGKAYKSLSPIATLITGTRWSGPAFFGTKRQGDGK